MSNRRCLLRLLGALAISCSPPQKKTQRVSTQRLPSVEKKTRGMRKLMGPVYHLKAGGHERLDKDVMYPLFKRALG